MAHTASMEQAKKGWFGRTVAWGKRSYAALTARKYTTIAGTLVFFLIMSLVPLAFWLTLLFGRAALDPDVLKELGLFGWAEDFLLFLRDNAAESASGASVLFLGTTLWSSTGFFFHLRRSGELIYDYRRKKHGWKVRLSAVGVAFCLLFFFAGAVSALITLSVAMRALPRWLSRIVEYAALLILGFFGAWILNAYVCPYRCRPRDIALGSLWTAIAWLVASGAFSVYMRFGNKEKLYGALSLIIVFLLWLYWMMICFTAGVIYNRRRMEVRTLEHKKL